MHTLVSRLMFVFVGLLAACGASGALPAAAVNLNQRGAEALSEQSIDDAEARFRLALEYHPRFAEAHANLGVVMLERGELEAAERHFRDAIELDPDFDEAWSNLGVTLFRLQREEDSLEAFEQALSIDPGLIQARQNLADLWIRRREFAEARAHLMRLVQLLEPSEEVWERAQVLLAYSEMRLGLEDDARQRLAGFELALPLGFLVRGQLRLRGGDEAGALEDFEQASRDRGIRDQALAMVACTKVLLGQLDEAEEMIGRLMPRADGVGLRLVAATLAFARRRYREAERYADEVLRLDPGLEIALRLKAEAQSRSR